MFGALLANACDDGHGWSYFFQDCRRGVFILRAVTGAERFPGEMHASGVQPNILEYTAVLWGVKQPRKLCAQTFCICKMMDVDGRQGDGHCYSVAINGAQKSLVGSALYIGLSVL